jgi:putative spermidine/putrescine transport system permease protein
MAATASAAVLRAAGVSTAAAVQPGPGLLERISTALYLNPRLLLFLLLTPPLMWLGVIYLGSLLSLLLQSFFYIDEFTGMVVREFSLATYRQLFTLANFDIVVRTTAMAGFVTVAAAALGFPLAYYMVRYASTRTKALLYLGVMLPLWSSYLVRVYSWKLILAKEGIVTWLAEQLHLTWLLEAVLALPVIGGPSLSTANIGTFLVFLYVWLPFMILPIVAALERVPRTLIEASADLGAHPAATFRNVIWPLALPGVVAGSIFTFSLTLGDYIIPGIVGSSHPFIGQAVYAHQGTAGNVPLAAALTIVPISIMAVYLTIAKRLGAFDAL